MDYPKTLPDKISLLAAAKILGCRLSTVCYRMGVIPVTGDELIPVAKLAKVFKCDPQILSDCIEGKDLLLDKNSAAAKLGVRTHSLHIWAACRASIVPVAELGRGVAGGFRYSRNVIEKHIAGAAIAAARPEARKRRDRKSEPAHIVRLAIANSVELQRKQLESAS